MKYLILISVLFLTACGSRVTSGEIAKARMYCSEKGGVHVIDTFLSPSVHCNSEDEILTSNITLVGEDYNKWK